MKKTFIALALFSVAAGAQASDTSCQSVTENEITSLFQQWNKGLKAKDPELMADFYAEDAVLLPTLSNEMRTNHAEIADYFSYFLKKGPQGEINERVVVLGCNKATDTGIYTFSFADGSKAQARYTYVYRFADNKWLISHHHSSVMPE
ncbi:hypothetical protein Rhein_2931 [Rheinheimera sp. A13L]|uniref:SgcJ/EcaC family oxidoreductase n=1 Tax=Rheinheimera sp. A13L TaxID=506534 RepID=UPI000212513D|nr:SgcJ/EcaC family oxidoreductase [Rheinheimera sp. A13L]EGM76991.1 hypothetical protein Rhein_2931 [Rheinheimera sp. A13L]